MRHLVYLHGFASSPKGHKVSLLRDFLKSEGYDAELHVPDLNVPDFTHLTLTAQINHIAETVGALSDGPVGLIGSSFGGLAALHFLHGRNEAEAQRVDKVMLLAPALNFLPRWQERLGEQTLKTWQSSGMMPFYHYAHDQELPLHYGLVEDVAQYNDDDLKPHLPVLIFHGKHDESVDYQGSVRFAERHPHVDLRLVESDHSLADQVPVIQQEIVNFFDLTR